MASVGVRVEGLDELKRKLAQTPQLLTQVVADAGNEIAAEVLDTEGLRQYPPAPRAYAPPYPYYVRGQGTQWSANTNSRTSERLGTQFYSTTKAYTITVGNRASYARYVIGDDQAGRMKAIGWRTLVDVAEAKLPRLTKILEGWVQRALDKL